LESNAQNSFSGLSRKMILDELSKNISKIIILNSNDEYVCVNKNEFSIIKNRLFFIESSKKNIQFTNDTPVKVFFYYKGRGLYFLNSFNHTKSGYAIVIPEIIYSQEDDEEKNKQLFPYSTIYFLSGENASVNIECFPLKSFNVFDRSLSKDLINSDTILEINNLESVKFFFSEKPLQISAVENRFKPLSILFLSHKQIVLGCSEKDMILKFGIEYAIKISVPMEIGRRIIFATIKVKKIIGDAKDILDYTQTCSLCEFTQIKEEDKRFLKEKVFN